MKVTDAIARLINLHFRRQLDAEGRQQLKDWLSASPDHQAYFDRVENTGIDPEYGNLLHSYKVNYDRLMQRLQPRRPSARIVTLLTYSVVAASVIALLIVGVWIFKRSLPLKPDNHPLSDSGKSQPIIPAQSRAVLTLDDGRKITLDSTTSGLIGYQGGAVVTATRGVVLDYSDTKQAQEGQAENTITTPKGGVFRVTLSDGTRVWLNAGSTMTYAARFRGARHVQLTGEAYFEVAHQKGVPFTVELLSSPEAGAPTAIEVLGTHFNVKAYPGDHQVMATLLQGAIRIRHGKQQALLHPGQQARLETDVADKIEVFKEMKVREVMGWKEGFFNYENADAKTILEDVARWYDLEVVWQTSVPAAGLYISINRNTGLQGTLQVLESCQVGLRFRVEDRKIIVTGQETK